MLSSVLGGCEDPEGPIVVLPLLLLLIVLRILRGPYHRLEAVRPTSGPVTISGVIHRPHVQNAVEEGRRLKANVRNHTGYQSWSILVLMILFFSRRSPVRRPSDPRANPCIIVQ